MAGGPTGVLGISVQKGCEKTYCVNIQNNKLIEACSNPELKNCERS